MATTKDTSLPPEGPEEMTAPTLLPKKLDFSSWQELARTEQQTWLEKLGDRTCDFMHLDQKKPLEMKVGFALYGLPSQSTTLYAYDKEKCDYIAKMCTKILDESKKFNTDGIYLSVIFVYCYIEESKILWKTKEAVEFQNTIFKISNGTNLKEEKFIDSNLRVYESWEKFKINNKYPKCWYALPKEGKYQGDSNGKVMIEFEKSPEWTMKRRMGNVLDTGGMLVGFGGAAVGVASIFNPVTGPILIGSLVAGGVSSAYTAGRCINKLADRHTHQQSISLKDKEALFVWIELTLSAVTVGVSASSVYSSVRAASAVATAGGEAATSASNVAKGSQVAAKAGKGGRASARAAARAASKAANVGKGAKAASKAAKDAKDVAKGATKLADWATKASKMAKSAGDISKKVSTAVDGAAKASDFTKKTSNIGKNIAKAAKKAAKAAKVARNFSKSAVKASEAARNAVKLSTGISTAAVEDVSLISKLLSFMSDLGSQSIQLIQSPGNAIFATIMNSTTNTESFKTIVFLGLKVIFSITFGLVTSKISPKHKDLLKQVLILYEKISSGTLDPTDITRFLSFINFYFNTLIKNHEAFLDRFLWELYETAKKITNQKKQEYKTLETQAPIICSLKISSDGSEIITSVFTELQNADIDLTDYHFFSGIQDQNSPSRVGEDTPNARVNNTWTPYVPQPILHQASNEQMDIKAEPPRRLQNDNYEAWNAENTSNITFMSLDSVHYSKPTESSTLPSTSSPPKGFFDGHDATDSTFLMDSDDGWDTMSEGSITLGEEHTHMTASDIGTHFQQMSAHME